MTQKAKETIIRVLAIIICIVLNLSILLAVTASALQTNLSNFLQLT
jgi:hypothetical protein